MDAGKLTAQTVAGVTSLETGALDAYEAASKDAEPRVPRVSRPPASSPADPQGSTLAPEAITRRS